MSAVISLLNDYIERISQGARAAVFEEFTSLDRQVKQMLVGLIANKQWSAAYKVAEQLTALLTEDLEVLKLKQKIFMHL